MRCGKYRNGDVRHASCDISAAQRELSWAPRCGLKEGIQALAQYLAEQNLGVTDRRKEDLAENLKDWVAQTQFSNKPWLVLGKGPTFSKLHEFNVDGYNTFSLNHVVRERKVNVAHVIDIDVVEACAKELLSNCDWLIMPRVPKVKFWSSQYINLQDWCQVIPELAELDRRGRLVVYDLSSRPTDDPWTVDAKFFSSEVAFGILAASGVRTVHSLGIDDGPSL